MSTRSIIARPTAHGFAGRYVHDGGHPRERVPTLLHAIQGHFSHNPDAAARFYLDEHPAGWSWLGTDFTTPPGWYAPAEAPRTDHNRCYCHGRCDDGPALLTQDNVDPLWHEWIYILRPDGLQVIRTDWRKCTQNWASHLLPWTTDPAAELPATLR